MCRQRRLGSKTTLGARFDMAISDISMERAQFRYSSPFCNDSVQPIVAFCCSNRLLHLLDGRSHCLNGIESPVLLSSCEDLHMITRMDGCKPCSNKHESALHEGVSISSATSLHLFMSSRDLPDDLTAPFASSHVFSQSDAPD